MGHHVVPDGPDEDCGDDPGLDLARDAPELLLGAHVGLGGAVDRDRAGLALVQPLLEPLEDCAIAQQGEEDRLVLAHQSQQFVHPGNEVGLDRLLARLVGELEQLREGRLALDEDRDDEVDLVLEVHVDRAFGASGCARDLARRRAGEAVLADQRVGRLDDAAAHGRLGVDHSHHE